MPLKVLKHYYVQLRVNKPIMKTTVENDIIIFDGECNLCNGVVGWLLKFAPEDIFQFTVSIYIRTTTTNGI